jgi:hypothetical protein
MGIFILDDLNFAMGYILPNPQALFHFRRQTYIAKDARDARDARIGRFSYP